MTAPRASTYDYGKTTPPTLEELIDRALELMKNDPHPIAAASTLFMRWAEGDADMAAMLPDLLTPYLEKRMKARASAKAGAK